MSDTRGPSEPNEQPQPTDESDEQNSSPAQVDQSPQEPASGPAASAPRPRPEYGEYAPEGWQSPVHGHGDSDQRATTHGASIAGAPTASAQYPLTGVPHNLGVQSEPGSAPSRGQTPPQPRADSQTGSQTPPQTPPQYGQTSTKQLQQPQHGEPHTHGTHSQPMLHAQGTKTSSEKSVPGSRIADRIVTIVLLAVGAFSALNMAMSFMTLGTGITLIAEVAGDKDFQLPPSIATISTIGTLAMLSIFAVMLIWSIQRLRRGKLAFWVPLAAGVLSIILLFVVISVAMAQVPGLVDSITPQDMDLLLQSLLENSSG